MIYLYIVGLVITGIALYILGIVLYTFIATLFVNDDELYAFNNGYETTPMGCIIHLLSLLTSAGLCVWFAHLLGLF